MNMGVGRWAGLMLNRMSFGFIGRLTDVWFDTNHHITLKFRDLSFTKDTLDPIKVAMSGVKAIKELLPSPSDNCLYLMMVTNQNKLRIMYDNAVVVTDYSVMGQWGGNVDGDIHPELVLTSIILEYMVLVSSQHERWNNFFLGGDDLWQETEASITASLPEWEKTTSILKTTLCPPIS